jgi:osmotically-inducible protein OsmY
MFNINVRTYKGIVTLTGSVGNYVARNQAGSIAKASTGVEIVNNQIVVDK